MAHELREKLWADGHWRIEIKPKHWVSKARYLLELALSRKLYPREKVVFVDRNPSNCNLSNLEIVDYEKKIRIKLLNNSLIIQSNKTWSRNHDFCVTCKKDDRQHGGNGKCILCYNREKYKVNKYRV